MSAPTSNQYSDPNQYNGTNVPCNGTGSQWNQNQPIGPEHLQNGTPLQWTGYLPQIDASRPVNPSSVASAEHITRNYNLNGFNQHTVYNPSNNIPYQSGTSNGYDNSNLVGNINGQYACTPNLIRSQNGQIFGSSNWPNLPYVSGYVPQAPTRSGNKVPGEVKKQKRVRTAFTTEQMMQLEQEYARARYLDRGRRIELAGILHLNERTIKIWFQNRRMKEKKERAESLEGSEASSSGLSPEMSTLQIQEQEQYPGMSNQVYNHAASTSTPMPGPSLSSTVPYNPIHIQNDNQYSEYILDDQLGYHQLQNCPTHESAESAVQEPVSTAAVQPTSATSDMSWISSIFIEEEF